MNIKLDNDLYQKLLLEAADSPRKRSHLNLHKDLNEPVQRLCIALKKGTYVRPHHHPKENKWELFLALKGSAIIIIFDEDGTILERNLLNQNDSMQGLEITPDTWHTIVPLSENVVVLEIKEGPYTPSVKTDFATWAPEEGEKNVNKFLQWLESAEIGERYINLTTMD